MVVHRLFPQRDLHVGVALKTQRRRQIINEFAVLYFLFWLPQVYNKSYEGLPSYLSVGVLGLQALSLDDVDPDQTLLDAVGRKFSELSGRRRGGGVVRERVDLKHTLVDAG